MTKTQEFKLALENCPVFVKHKLELCLRGFINKPLEPTLKEIDEVINGLHNAKRLVIAIWNLESQNAPKGSLPQLE